jgi:hypothetical protein
MKTTASKQTVPPATTTSTTNAPLSSQWAFVVQFRALPGGSVQEAGRVEHLVSGRSARFQSFDELVKFLTEVCSQPGVEA